MQEQKVWLITGASRGIGLEIVKVVLAMIATVRRSPEILLGQLGNPANLNVRILDIINEEQAKEAVDQIVSKFGKIDVLVNNARIRTPKCR